MWGAELELQHRTQRLQHPPPSVQTAEKARAAPRKRGRAALQTLTLFLAAIAGILSLEAHGASPSPLRMLGPRATR